ncbi:MAG: magnesium/cobalt transporter CorA [Planctomycetota bacterium]|jgi:magnesium transporter
MARLIKKGASKAGLPPGTLVHIGERKARTVRITYIDYDEQNLQEKEVSAIEECFPFKATPTVTWINIDGMHQVDIIEKLGRHFELHPLTLEDILNTGQRPKLEDFESYVFVVLKMLSYNGPTGAVQSEQVSLVIGQNFVISLQERAGDVFEPIRDRIRNSKGRIRRMGADYLAYALMDAVVDNYFVILEKLGERVESLEEELVGSPTENTLQQIHSLKREMIFLRRSVWPLREVISGLERGESSLVGESTGVYLRDVYDHTIQIMDTIESLRDMVSGMLEIYLSSMSNKMNAAMKVLTVIATIFIPLSFFAGVYGMNFEHMPELRWRWVYPYGFWAAIVGVVALMLVLFRRKKWL